MVNGSRLLFLGVRYPGRPGGPFSLFLLVEMLSILEALLFMCIAQAVK